MKTKMDIGKRWYRSGVVMRFAAGASAFAILQVPLGAEVTFERVTGGAIAEHPDAFSGCAWGDYDGDGFVDLFASGGGGGGTNKLFRNEGDGSFSNVAWDEVSGGGSSASWGDFENDGDLDLFIPFLGMMSPGGGAEDRFYRNENDGTFLRMTEGDWVNDDDRGLASAWVDYDRDGLLDVFVSNHKEANLLYHHEFDGTMVSVPLPPLPESHSFGCTWSDFDLDGDPDLFIAGQSILYRNDGDDVFTEITPDLLPGAPVETGLAKLFGVATGDYDNDGDFDLALGANAGSKNRIYRNDLESGWVLLTDNVIYEDNSGYSFSPLWGDYDNDGWLDLLITRRASSSLLYHNERDGTFAKATLDPLTSDVGLAYAGAWADYDNDGDLDVVLVDGQGWGGTASPPRPLALYRNEGGTNHWLLLNLVGTASNRSAMGAKVYLEATIDGVAIQQLREVTGSTGDGCQNDLRVHFGMGDAAVAENIRIEWPSGAIEEFTDVEANQILTVTEVSIPEPLIGGKSIPGLPGWFLSEWFGIYYTDFAPWLFHAEHGFVFRFPESTNESTYFYDNGMGAWWWTNETNYPSLYVFDPPADNVGADIESAWLWYFEGSIGPRTFGVMTGASAGQALFFGP